MADIDNNKKAFQVDGLELRSKQKPIIEDSFYSASIEVDQKSSAKVFLHNDGQLYFKDNTIKNPIPLTKVKNIYDRLKFEDGELRFYDRELNDYVSLSEMNTNKLPFQKNNSEVFSNSTVFDLDPSFNANEVLTEAYSNYGAPITGNVYTEDEIYDAQEQFKTVFDTYTVDVLEETALDAMFTNFLTGILDPSTEPVSGAISGFTPLTLQQIQELGFSSFDEYINGKDFGGDSTDDDYVWSTDYLISDKSLFLGDDVIGFIEQPGDRLGKKYLAGEPLSAVLEYMYENFYQYNGIGNYLDQIFNAIPTLTTTPTISGSSISGGVFEGFAVEEISTEIIEEISRAVSHTMFDEFMIQFQEQLLNANLLVNNTIRPAEDILGAPSVWALAEQALQTMTNPLTKTKMLDAVDLAFSPDITTLLAMNTSVEFQLGGLFGAINLLPIDFITLNEQWFDLPNMWKVSPIVSNKNALTLTAHFPINIKPRKNTRYEFRLIDTVSGIELDRVQVESASSKNIIGDIFADKTETHPIQLSYFGPMPEFVCNQESFQECFTADDVLTHVKIFSDDCLNANPIGKESGYRNIADRFLENITTELNEDEAIQIDTPRIFRVQWRSIYLDEDYSKLTHYKTLSNLTFDQLDGYGEARMSMSVYNIGQDDNANNLIKKGTVTFDNDVKKSVPFDFPLGTDSNYSISLTCSKNIKVWYETKTNNGFTIRAEKEFQGEVSWIFAKKLVLEAVPEETPDFPLCLVDTTPAFGSRSNFDILRDEGYNI